MPQFFHSPYPLDPKIPSFLDNQAGLCIHIGRKYLTDTNVYFMLFPPKSNVWSRKSAGGGLSMTKRKVGVVGLGNMGGGIARNFQKSGVPLAVWDIRPAAYAVFDRVAGVDIVPPGEMAATCNVIFFVVPATPEIESCFEGEDGVLARAAEGLVVYDFTTSDPIATRNLATRAASQSHVPGSMGNMPEASPTPILCSPVSFQ